MQRRWFVWLCMVCMAVPLHELHFAQVHQKEVSIYRRCERFALCTPLTHLPRLAVPLDETERTTRFQLRIYRQPSCCLLVVRNLNSERTVY